MKKSVLLLAIIFTILTLTSCTQRATNETVAQGSITIETYASVSTQTATSESETAPVYSAIEASDSSVSTTTAPESVNETTAVVETEVSSDYVVTDYEATMYAVASVNVRQLPDPDSYRIGHLDKGESVHVTGIVSNGWYRIEFKNGEYFVNGRYLSDIYEDDEETTTAVTTTVTTAATTITTTVSTITSVTTTTSDEDVQIDDEIDIDEIIDELGSNSYTALNYSTVKAVWFAYLDIDTMLAEATEKEFTESISEAFEYVSSMGFNTVYVHVRAFGDAYYYSDYYPFTSAYSGTVGDKPSYDPLEIMISEAHKLGLSFHAWVNPMRTTTKKNLEAMSSSYTLKQWYSSSSTNGTYLVYDSDTGYYWLSPAYSAVRELICAGIAEIVSNYDVDGIHIDDYFYPTTDESFDKLAFSVSGSSNLVQWRRDTVSQLVKEIYSTVKSCNQSVLFGVSPQGNLDNNLNKLYADVELWCSTSGYLDYIVPQIYYGYTGSLPFDTTAVQWENIVTSSSVQLICGIAAYKVGTTTEWSSGSMLSKQTDYISTLSGYSGCAYYRYSSLVASSSDTLLKGEIASLIKSLAGL
ncbi:MAG: family 10 glycosylhydrolase [Oscillospiraceae bacterium]|nr:family 10 glycosylhydrolase [Oscillospiraceae bacterium]